MREFMDAGHTKGTKDMHQTQSPFIMNGMNRECTLCIMNGMNGECTLCMTQAKYIILVANVKLSLRLSQAQEKVKAVGCGDEEQENTVTRDNLVSEFFSFFSSVNPGVSAHFLEIIP